MKRTKLADRSLPVYSMGEEIANTATHLLGGVLGIAALILCVLRAAALRGAPEITGAAIYGSCLVLLYCTSSLYHGLRPGMAKKVLRRLYINSCFIEKGSVGMTKHVWGDPFKADRFHIFGPSFCRLTISESGFSICLRKYKMISIVSTLQFFCENIRKNNISFSRFSFRLFEKGRVSFKIGGFGYMDKVIAEINICPF